MLFIALLGIGLILQFSGSVEAAYSSNRGTSESFANGVSVHTQTPPQNPPAHGRASLPHKRI
jgi:hypothetical protein